MKQIYFSTHKENLFKHVLKSGLTIATEKTAQFLPGLTTQLAEKILCTPHRSKKQFKTDGFQIANLSVLGHEVKVYSKGEFQKTVLFVHGWAGSAADFQEFYPQYLAQGYNVVAFDHIAHGKSSGKVVNLFLFGRAIEEVYKMAQSKNSLVGVVAHSMGTSAVIGTMGRMSLDLPLVLIAPLVTLFDTLYSSVENFGISKSWVTELLKTFEKRYSMNIKDIDPMLVLPKLTNPILAIHDRHDTTMPLATNEAILPEEIKKTMVVTEKLGHFKILKAPQVIQHSVEFINARSK